MNLSFLPEVPDVSCWIRCSRWSNFWSIINTLLLQRQLVAELFLFSSRCSTTGRTSGFISWTSQSVGAQLAGPGWTPRKDMMMCLRVLWRPRSVLLEAEGSRWWSSGAPLAGTVELSWFSWLQSFRLTQNLQLQVFLLNLVLHMKRDSVEGFQRRLRSCCIPRSGRGVQLWIISTGDGNTDWGASEPLSRFQVLSSVF